MPITKLVTAVELAALVSVTPDTISRWRKDNRIPCIRINASTIRYDPTEVERALRKRSDELARKRSGR